MASKKELLEMLKRRLEKGRPELEEIPTNEPRAEEIKPENRKNPLPPGFIFPKEKPRPKEKRIIN